MEIKNTEGTELDVKCAVRREYLTGVFRFIRFQTSAEITLRFYRL